MTDRGRRAGAAQTRTRAQRHSVRMVRLKMLVQIDLPVDVVVVLEQ